MAPQQLWQMSDEEFNKWREQNDYPRIISFLKNKLPQFDEWMTDQKISDDLLKKYSPSTFLCEKPSYYLYKVLYDDKEEKEILSTLRYSVNEIFFHKNLVKQRQDILTYSVWYRKKTKKFAPYLHISSKQGRSHRILGELELLDLGNCRLNNLMPIGNRHLDFVNISDIYISNCINNTPIKLWFCSAVNVTIEGDLAFIDAYRTSFYEIFSLKYRNLKLLNGNFQRWVFEDCEVNFTASNAILHLWKFTGWDFNGTITNTDIRDCTFQSSEVKYPIGYGRARDYHSQIKRLYSQIGKRGEASKHFYWEKTFERKSFLHLRENYQTDFYKNKSRRDKAILYTRYFGRYLSSHFQNILWGYGERPARVFGISIITILLFAICYCFFPKSSPHTHLNITNSLYYSMVTFSTLGYGDITQTGGVLRILSGIEAILGMSFWGILIAGFTNNSKDY